MKGSTSSIPRSIRGWLVAETLPPIACRYDNVLLYSLSCLYVLIRNLKRVKLLKTETLFLTQDTVLETLEYTAVEGLDNGDIVR